jgi:hypothetical protein
MGEITVPMHVYNLVAKGFKRLNRDEVAIEVVQVHRPPGLTDKSLEFTLPSVEKREDLVTIACGDIMQMVGHYCAGVNDDRTFGEGGGIDPDTVLLVSQEDTPLEIARGANMPEWPTGVEEVLTVFLFAREFSAGIVVEVFHAPKLAKDPSPHI